MGACGVDFFHRRNHPDAALRRLHLLLREGQPAGSHPQLPRLIIMSHTHSQSYSHRPRPACPPARLPACLSLCSWLILSPYMMDEIDRGVIACRRIQYIQYISISMRTANIDRSRSGFTLQGRNSSPNLLVPRGAPQRNASVHSEHLWNML